MATKLKERHEIPEKYLWNTDSIFESPEAWAETLAIAKEQVTALGEYEGTLGDGPDTLFEWLESSHHVGKRLYRLYVYPSLQSSADMREQAPRAMVSQIQSLLGRYNAVTAFAMPEILALGHDTIEAWIEESTPLALYRHYLDNLFRMAPHVRAPEVEAVLGRVSEPFDSTSQTAAILTNAELSFRDAVDSEGERDEVGHGTLRGYLSSHDRTLRRSAWESYADGYLSIKDTLTNTLKTAVQQDVFVAEARRYDSTLEASLDPYNLSSDVFHNLIDTFQRHLPIWHRYWKIRRQALGVETLYPYDVWAPLTPHEPHIPYEQAVEWIAEGMAPLGDEYVEVLRRGSLEERWVDVYPNRGKRQGAFSSGAPGTFPFLLVSYNDDIRSLSTLAHELGHSMHSYFTWKSQPPVYSSYSIFAAEVASNFNQAMVRDHLFRTQSDPEFQIALIEEAMVNFHRYFFIMPTLARFELELHKMVQGGEGITSSGLIDLAADLFAEGYGGEMVFDHERQGITWAAFNHLYRNFYVFQYATGISGAHALAERVLSGEEGAAEAYLDFLKAGSSTYALDALKGAGVDMTTPEPVETAFGILEDYVDRLEELTQ